MSRIATVLFHCDFSTSKVLGLNVTLTEARFKPADFQPQRAADVLHFLTDLLLEAKREAAAVFRAGGPRDKGASVVPLVYDTIYREIAYRWQDRIMTIDEPRAKCLVGFAPADFTFRNGVSFHGIRLDTPADMPYAIQGERYVAIGMVALDGKPLAQIGEDPPVGRQHQLQQGVRDRSGEDEPRHRLCTRSGALHPSAAGTAASHARRVSASGLGAELSARRPGGGRGRPRPWPG